jgi:hypothetical protein
LAWINCQAVPGSKGVEFAHYPPWILEALYGGAPQALPVARVRLQAGAIVEEAAVRAEDRSAVFHVPLDAGPVDLAATLLDPAGRPLCSAFYVHVRRAN